MSESILATIQVSLDDLRWIIEQSSINSAFLHAVITEHRVDIFSVSPVEKRRTYTSFNEFYFAKINVYDDFGIHTSFHARDILRAIKNLEINNTNQLVRIEILGERTDNLGDFEKTLATEIRIHGGISWDIYCPQFDTPEYVTQFSKRFSDSDIYLDEQQTREYEVEIKIPVSQINTLVKRMDDRFQKGLYIICVKNEQLVLTLKEKHGTGSIIFNPYSLSGPDVLNYYTEEFRNVFDQIQGDVTMYTDPEEKELAVVHSEREGCTIRHAIEAIGVEGKLSLYPQNKKYS